MKAVAAEAADLLALPAFVAAHPPRAPFVVIGDPAAVYLHPFERLILTLERTPDTGYGLWRSDALGERDICCAAVDSKAFADELVQSLAPHLSIRNLKDLVAATSAELDQRERQRAASI